MIRHIVTFKLAAESAEQRAEQAAWIAAQLESLIPLIPEIQSLSMGIDVNVTPGNADVVLVSEFADHAALDTYQVHPDHVRVSSGIKPLVAVRAAIDYEV
ncbi:Dabb family protein [Subtercola endophyticus]|uniref:Dabb family protein n=1 Tax=Subtercola endophyticus TaxID=2895559 RepID=UPI001E5A81A9|nr:Dabb family protein [Subtercola endophyticus]UFS58034.1 Dabb family protein [Subtercola endophyticus]